MAASYWPRAASSRAFASTAMPLYWRSLAASSPVISLAAAASPRAARVVPMCARMRSPCQPSCVFANSSALARKARAGPLRPARACQVAISA